jgi:prephenate dehydrogenase
MRVAGILGTGLIGASVGMELRQLGWSVQGWDPNPQALAVASERGAIDVVAADVEAAIDGAELIVLAGPLNATIAELGNLDTDALVTDVASVKQPVVAAAPPTLRFVGSHPMAGREHAGPAAASRSLFRGATWVVTSDGATPADVDALSAVIAALGATPMVMTAAEHDRFVASVSHVPHLLAVALLAGIDEDDRAAALAAGGFRDLTRVASSDTGWWPEVLVANAAQVDDSLAELVRRVESVQNDLRRGERGRLRERLDAARTRRQQLAPSLVRVRVVMQDKPGEIAAVGRALEATSVDVRDLQLRHAPHGGGGVLTLSVRPGEAPVLRAALEGEGFELD